MNFEKQKGIKKQLINQTLNLGKKMLKKQKLRLGEKITNFLCEKLVRKKIEISLVEIFGFVSGVELWIKILENF